MRETGPRHLGYRFRTVPLGFSNRNGHVTLNFILNCVNCDIKFCAISSKVKKYKQVREVKLSY